MQSPDKPQDGHGPQQSNNSINKNNYNADHYKQIAEELNIPYNVVKAAVESQFEVVRNTIKSADWTDSSTYKNIRLRHLGLIVAKSKTKINND